MLICCGSGINKKKIAEFKSGAVYFSEALDELNKMPNDKKTRLVDYDECYRFVRKIALEKIMLDKAYKEELDKEKIINDSLEKIKKNTAFEVLKKKNITDKIDVVKEDYRDYKKRYELYQIVKRTDMLDSSKIIESRKLLEELSKSIKDFSSFKENARKYSDDVSASNDGYVGIIRLGIMEEPIDKVIKKLKAGEVSDVVESSNGIHLLFINKIEEISDDELYGDRETYELIYNQKKEKLTDDWYDRLLKDGSLKINAAVIDRRVYDDETVIKYKDKKMTRKDFFQTVDRYKDDNFPEPTKDELVKLLNNLSLGFVLEDKALNSDILKSKEFKEKIREEKKFLILNAYINKHVVIPEIKDQDIEDFYKKNLKTLFTFKLDNGVLYEQPLTEVKKFITQKIETENVQNSRYDLYRRLVEDDGLKIERKLIEELAKRISR